MLIFRGRGLGEDWKGRWLDGDKENIGEWGGKREGGCGGNLGGENKREDTITAKGVLVVFLVCIPMHLIACRKFH